MEWIFSRTLVDSGGNEVQVAVGAPRQVSTGFWHCDFTVSGQAPEVRQAIGLDSFQALFIAVDAIRRIVEESQLQLTWEGGRPGDAGIPRLTSLGLPLAVRRHVENILDVEEQFWERRLGGDRGSPDPGGSPKK